ncbi:hypothetical protein LDENG_00263910 [Lucifuga dentata]|nr:hypothetical protein LDENG_00263910 [Lucifuga dentata]
MTTPGAAKERETVLRVRKTNSQKTKTALAKVSADPTKIADIADVLAELKSLRTEFGSKLDGIDTHIGDVTNSITDLKRDVSTNTTRIEEAEKRIVR